MVLNEEVSKTQKIVEDMLKSGSSKSSYYVDAIVRELPESILLIDLDYQPLAKRIRPERPIEIEENTVMISGESTNSDGFSKWLALMEANAWVKQVDILDYRDVSANLSNFNIKITMADVP
jgi:Tfp pilus assembly protein PilN